MHYKKQTKILLIILGIVLLALLTVLGAALVKKSRSQEAERKEMHLVTIYKSSEGQIGYDSELKTMEDDHKIVLQAEEGCNIDLEVMLLEENVYQRAEIVDHAGLSVVASEEYEQDRVKISFDMPKEDVIVHIFYESPVSETETEQEESESETLLKVAVEGLSDAILKSYNGCFDKIDFVNAICSFFAIDSPYSDYNMVYKVTFTDEPYQKDSEQTISHCFYFNEDKEWRGLATYNFTDRSYSFRDLKEEEEQKRLQESEKKKDQQKAETENNQIEVQESETEDPIPETASQVTIWETEAQLQEETQVQEHTEEVAVDLKKVSEELLDYIGDSSIFDAVAGYLFDSGLRGKITGTMIGHQLYPREKRAAFTIHLSTGDEIDGIYNKKSGTYSFEGLN